MIHHGIRRASSPLWELKKYKTLASAAKRRDSIGSRTVSDGDLLKFSIAGRNIKFEIYYHHKLAIISQSGEFSQEFVFLPNKHNLVLYINKELVEKSSMYCGVFV